MLVNLSQPAAVWCCTLHHYWHPLRMALESVTVPPALLAALQELLAKLHLVLHGMDGRRTAAYVESSDSHNRGIHVYILYAYTPY